MAVERIMEERGMRERDGSSGLENGIRERKVGDEDEREIRMGD